MNYPFKGSINTFADEDGSLSLLSTLKTHAWSSVLQESESVGLFVHFFSSTTARSSTSGSLVNVVSANIIYMWFFLSCKHACMGAVCLRMPVIGKSYQAEVAGIIRTGSWLWKNGAVPGWRHRAPAGNSDGSVACGRRGRSARCPAWSRRGQTGWEACPVDCKGVESPGWDEEEDWPGMLCWFRWQTETEDAESPRSQTWRWPRSWGRGCPMQWMLNLQGENWMHYLYYKMSIFTP